MVQARGIELEIRPSCPADEQQGFGTLTSCFEGGFLYHFAAPLIGFSNERTQGAKQLHLAAFLLGFKGLTQSRYRSPLHKIA